MTTPRIVVQRHEANLYEWLIVYDHVKATGDIGHTSITECLRDAADSLPADERIAEVEYRGVHMGTYPKTQLRELAHEVADSIVESYGAIAQHF